MFFYFDFVFKIRCLFFSTSCYPAWPSLRHVMVFHLLQTMLRCLILSSWCYAAWYSFPHGILLDRPYLMLRCLICSISCHAAWSCLHDATQLDLLYTLLRCLTFPTVYYVSWGRLYHDLLLILSSSSSLPFAALLGLPYVMSWCSIFSNHVTLLGLVFMMLHSVIFSASCSAAGPSLPDVMTDVLCQIFAVCFLILSWWCYAAWSSLHPATLLDLPYRILCCVRSSLSWFATDLVFKFFSTFCCAAWPSLRHVMVLHLLQSCYTAWSCLHDATLRDLLCLMLCCWTVSAWCYDWRPLSDLCCLFFDLVLMMLRCLIFSTSCCAAWHSLPNHVSLLALVFMMLRCLLFTSCYTSWACLYHAIAASSCLCHAMLLDLVSMMLHCLAFPSSPYAV